MAFGASIKYSEFVCRLNFSDGTFGDFPCYMRGHEKEGEPSRAGNAQDIDWWRSHNPRKDLAEVVSVELVKVENHDKPPLPPIF